MSLFLDLIERHGPLRALALCLAAPLLAWVVLAMRRRGLVYWALTALYVALSVSVLAAAQCVSQACPDPSACSPDRVIDVGPGS